MSIAVFQLFKNFFALFSPLPLLRQNFQTLSLLKIGISLSHLQKKERKRKMAPSVPSAALTPKNGKNDNDNDNDDAKLLKARCRAEVFEYSGLLPAQLVKKHLCCASVFEVTTKNSNYNHQHHHQHSFERCVMQTQEKLLERCAEEEETKNSANPFAKTLERRRVEEVLRMNFEANSTTSGAYRRLENKTKKMEANVKCILDAYEASLDETKCGCTEEDGDSIRVDFFCLFLFMHGINLPSAKSPMKANAEWYSSLTGGGGNYGGESSSTTHQNNEQQQKSERDKEEFVRMKFLISHWNDIKTIATKTDDLIDSPGLISANSWECFQYVFQFYDANEMKEVDSKAAKEKLQTALNIYRLLEDCLSSISSFSGALKKPFELRVGHLKKQTFARELLPASAERNVVEDEILSSCLISD